MCASQTSHYPWIPAELPGAEGEQDRGEAVQGVSRKGPDSRGQQARGSHLSSLPVVFQE